MGELNQLETKNVSSPMLWSSVPGPGMLPFVWIWCYIKGQEEVGIGCL